MRSTTRPPHLAAGSEESVPAPADVPLAEALASCGDDDVQSEPPQKKRKVPEDNMKIHAYVNRVVPAAIWFEWYAKTPRL
ncbi:hypothetical protein PI124_g23287 [Phytophthora idaei]|nr:hypothetical protein PI125_g25375 [Phytophthora idaei]KAG3231618.1 hypothetical protein PI124_g23287 [Phytophthora idaei]